MLYLESGFCKMDIYKLSDFEEKKGGCFRITDLKQGVKNPNRVNVFVDNEFAFSLDVAQVVDYKVKVGREISKEEFDELKNASEFGKLYQRALEWVLIRPRSERETRDYLRRRRPELCEDVICRLRSHGYLDDRKFAAWWVENRFVNKGVSAKRLRMELMKKGVSKEIIDDVLEGSERNDADEIRKIIKKKRARYDDKKLMEYLARQGFSYDLIKELINE